MITVEEAQAKINEVQLDWGVEKVDIESSGGRILAEDIVAKRNYPPFDRVCMDGVAISYTSEKDTFSIKGMQLAGSPSQQLEEGTAIEVMTGAMLPLNADTVIPYENFEKNGGEIKLTHVINKGQNIHFEGEDAKVGEVILTKNKKIGAVEMALLATEGYTSVNVKKLPKVAIISTGDELVGVGDEPKPYQIRRSNNFMIGECLRKKEISISYFHLNDNKEELKEKISSLLNEFDLLILSGGVSRGKVDFLPEVFEELLVEKFFHRVKQKPGKPFWFGKKDNCCVFALPGNPVSTLVCYLRYVELFINRIMGVEIETQKVILAEDFTFKKALTFFLSVRLSIVEGKCMAIPVKGNGSGDFRSLENCDGFVELNSEKQIFRKGEVVDFYSFK